MTVLGVHVPRDERPVIREEFRVSLDLVRSADDGSLDMALRRLWLAFGADGVST